MTPFDSASTTPGGGTIFTEPVLVVQQKAKVIELTNEYAVTDPGGTPLGSVRQVGQSKARKLLRLVSNVDSLLSATLQLTDPTGQVLLQISRPATVWKSTVVVADGAGNEIGKLVQENAVGKIRFRLEAGGEPVGMLKAENWRAWDFSIEDGSGTEVARVTKKWEGLSAAMFTTADRYVVQLHRPLEEPLRSLVVAAAVTVDTVLKQSEK